MPKQDMSRLVAQMDSLLGEDARQETPSAPAPAEPARVKRVLVIDDNRDYRDLVRGLLCDHGYRVVEARDGAEGLRFVLDAPPDLVIVDFNMPRMNGFEFVQEMKSLVETRRIPIIMFSGAPNRRHIKEIGLDLVEFLDKPVANATLLQAVQRTLGSPVPAEVPPTSPASPPQASVAQPPPPSAPEPAPAPAAEEAAETWESDEALLELIKVEKEKEPDEAEGLETLSKDSPLINKVNQILVRSVEIGASDIHIEPQEKAVSVRVRVDGSLRPLCSLPGSLRARLCARVKIMANLIITEHRLPQDGQFHAQIKARPVEFRVSTLPSAHGEKIVLRILRQSQLKADLRQLGLGPRDHECVEKILKSPHGLILATGPTGSGKTTTLYTMLGVLNASEVNIMTAEDPIEYRLPGITQSQIRPAIGLTFESVLRAFLRQDPDIMLVGEIRDRETAEIAAKASITGHLVFSAVHTNSAPATVMRLTHMGLPPFLVAASLKLIVAQRLIRLLCPACKLSIPLPEEDKRFLSEEEIAALKTVWRPRGCPACHQAGYSGRRPIFEVMPLQTSAMRQAILSPESSTDLITDIAVKEGMTSLRQAAFSAVGEGATSLHEVFPIVLGER